MSNTTINDGGPAFPHAHEDYPFQHGMSLRDWFAGQALAGFTSSWYDRYKDDDATLRGQGPELIALAAYVHADAMLAARERK